MSLVTDRHRTSLSPTQKAFFMIQDLFSWLLATFVIGPMQAEFASKMQVAQAPAAIVQQIQDCVVASTPILVSRAISDPWWGITTTISVVTGLSDAKSVLAEMSPDCAAAVGSVRPFLEHPEISEYFG